MEDAVLSYCISDQETVGVTEGLFQELCDHTVEILTSISCWAQFCWKVVVRSCLWLEFSFHEPCNNWGETLHIWRPPTLTPSRIIHSSIGTSSPGQHMGRAGQFFHELLSFYEAINLKGRAQILEILQGDGRNLTEHQKTPEGEDNTGNKLLFCSLTDPLIHSFSKHVPHSQHYKPMNMISQ